LEPAFTIAACMFCVICIAVRSRAAPSFLPLLFFYCSGAHRDLHSFPTRRSSDLRRRRAAVPTARAPRAPERLAPPPGRPRGARADRKSTRLNSSHLGISYAVFCLKKKKKQETAFEPSRRRAKVKLLTGTRNLNPD